jgi:hypothetical protein
MLRRVRRRRPREERAQIPPNQRGSGADACGAGASRYGALRDAARDSANARCSLLGEKDLDIGERLAAAVPQNKREAGFAHSALIRFLMFRDKDERGRKFWTKKAAKQLIDFGGRIRKLSHFALKVGHDDPHVCSCTLTFGRAQM